jgi:hypothetical protein
MTTFPFKGDLSDAYSIFKKDLDILKQAGWIMVHEDAIAKAQTAAVADYIADNASARISELEQARDSGIKLGAEMERSRDKGEEVTLDSLIGLRSLSGVYFVHPDGFETDEQYCNFSLDGVLYAATEHAEDGYRSCLDSIWKRSGKTANKFTPIKVFGTMTDEVLSFIDINNGKAVLRVGTDHSDSYYPHFVSEFDPINMSTNNQESEV